MDMAHYELLNLLELIFSKTHFLLSVQREAATAVTLIKAKVISPQVLTKVN